MKKILKDNKLRDLGALMKDIDKIQTFYHRSKLINRPRRVNWFSKKNLSSAAKVHFGCKKVGTISATF